MIDGLSLIGAARGFIRTSVVLALIVPLRAALGASGVLIVAIALALFEASRPNSPAELVFTDLLDALFVGVLANCLLEVAGMVGRLADIFRGANLGEQMGLTHPESDLEHFFRHFAVALLMCSGAHRIVVGTLYGSSNCMAEQLGVVSLRLTAVQVLPLCAALLFVEIAYMLVARFVPGFQASSELYGIKLLVGLITVFNLLPIWMAELSGERGPNLSACMSVRL